MRDLAKAKVILIAGPTASGKSSLALQLAERFGGVIINADSMQVYSELRIISARPGVDDISRAPHLLYGHVPAREAYSAGRFIAEAAQAMADAQARRLLPIFVGGTGLYFQALLEGLAPVPQVDRHIRERWRREAEVQGAPRLHAVLGDRDPVMAARLALTDAQRIVRALEVLDSTGRSLAEWQRERSRPVVEEAGAVRLLLTADREALQTRAEARVDAMIAAGAMAEAAALADLQLPPTLPAMRAIGVRAFADAARGSMALDAAADAVKAETRQYVKRQQTWLKRNMIAWETVETN